jgi:predicted esterase YcpF (UPF0227 family)
MWSGMRLLYLHGFNSSPQSFKAQALMRYMREHDCLHRLICLQIPSIPEQARRFLDSLVERELKSGELAFAGSSLGGYYATYLAEKYSGTAVLINPSVRPYQTLEACLGENKFYHSDEYWQFDRSHIDQLKTMEVEQITEPDRYLVLLQTGDETLDYRQAAEKYSECRCVIEEGGDHAFTGFEDYIEQILEFSDVDC